MLSWINNWFLFPPGIIYHMMIAEWAQCAHLYIYLHTVRDMCCFPSCELFVCLVLMKLKGMIHISTTDWRRHSYKVRVMNFNKQSCLPHSEITDAYIQLSLLCRFTSMHCTWCWSFSPLQHSFIYVLAAPHASARCQLFYFCVYLCVPRVLFVFQKVCAQTSWDCLHV